MSTGICMKTSEYHSDKGGTRESHLAENIFDSSEVIHREHSDSSSLAPLSHSDTLSNGTLVIGDKI